MAALGLFSKLLKKQGWFSDKLDKQGTFDRIIIESESATTPYVISNNTGATFSGTEDTYLLESNPTGNFGSATTLAVKAWTTGDRAHSVIKFTGLASVPAGTISNAKLRFYCETIGNDPFDLPTVHAYALRRDFVEAQATWNIYQTGSNWGTAGALDNATDYNNSLLGSVLVNTEATFYEISGSAVTAYVQAIVSGGTDFGLFLPESNFAAPASQFKEAIITSSEGTDGRRPEISFDWTAPSSSIVDGVGASKSGTKSNASGVKVATGVGASKTGAKSNASGFKIGQSTGESKIGTSANAIGQAGSVVSSIGASNNGIKNNAAGFKVAIGIGASSAGVDNSASGSKTAQSNGSSKLGIDSSATGVKTAVSQSSSKIGIDSSASGSKIASSNSSAKVGFDGSASGTKTAQGFGASKIGSTGNAIGTSSTISSSIGASDVGITGSASGAKTAQGAGNNKQGTKSNASGLKVASGVGASKVGAKSNAAGVAIAIQSGIGTSKLGSKSSVSGTKTTQSIGANKQATASNATGFKIAVGVGSCKAGVKSTPAGELYIPTIPKKITNLRGPEWITVSQGFWNS